MNLTYSPSKEPIFHQEIIIERKNLYSYLINLKKIELSCQVQIIYRTRAISGRSRLVAAPLRIQTKRQFLLVFDMIIGGCKK